MSTLFAVGMIALLALVAYQAILALGYYGSFGAVEAWRSMDTSRQITFVVGSAVFVTALAVRRVQKSRARSQVRAAEREGYLHHAAEEWEAFLQLAAKHPQHDIVYIDFLQWASEKGCAAVLRSGRHAEPFATWWPEREPFVGGYTLLARRHARPGRWGDDAVVDVLPGDDVAWVPADFYRAWAELQQRPEYASLEREVAQHS